RLRPWPLGGGDIGVGELAGALAGKAGLERMARRPPDLGGEPVAARAERIDHRGEQQSLADGDDLRAETLLRRLRPEGGEVGRDHVAGYDLGIHRLEGRNLRSEVVVHELVAAGGGELVAGLRERRRQAALRIPPGMAACGV